MKGWNEIFHANGNEKNPEIAVLILYKIDFRTETVIRDKEGHNNDKNQSNKKI